MRPPSLAGHPRPLAGVPQLGLVGGLDWSAIEASLHCSENGGLAQLTGELQDDLRKLAMQLERCQPEDIAFWIAGHSDNDDLLMNL